MRQSLKEESIDGRSTDHGDAFSTPCFKAVSSAFVAKRSNYCRLPDCSPLPDAISNMADADTWLKMNKGYIADLDSLQITPARRFQSFPLSDATPVSFSLHSLSPYTPSFVTVNASFF